MEVTRSLFQTARGYTESFAVYGEKMTVEWPQVDSDDALVVFSMAAAAAEAGKRGKPLPTERVSAPDRQDLLPPASPGSRCAASTTTPTRRSPSRLAAVTNGSHPAPGPRVRAQHRRGPQAPHRRAPRRLVDGGGNLRAPVGHEGREAGGGAGLRVRAGARTF